MDFSKAKFGLQKYDKIKDEIEKLGHWPQKPRVFPEDSINPSPTPWQQVVDQIIDGTLCLNMGYVAQIKRIEGEKYEGETIGECIARGSSYTFMIDEQCEGGAYDDEDHNHWQPQRVDSETILDGILVVQEKYPHIWARYVADAADAGDDDAVFQCAIFRNIIFG